MNDVDIQNNDVNKQIMKLHNLIYRFTYDKLTQFKKDEFAMTFFKHYFHNHFAKRVEQSKFMKKYHQALVEAAEKIIL